MHVSRFQNFLSKQVEQNLSFFLKLGNFESQWLKDVIFEKQIDRPIYVTGLARSGSTILLEMLASHTDVASHQYRDFPMVYNPVWWNWFLDRASSGKPITMERAHKDRIKVSSESPEAMEEAIWMAYFADSHNPTKSSIIGSQENNPDFETFYRNHLRKILFVRNGSRYLAKGNYNISRLEYIKKIFPDARFVIPVREPVHHIASLMKQHKLFCDVESEDPRILAHMQRSGHFEFGLDCRPINFDNLETTQRIERLWHAGHNIRGWAVYWSSVYAHIVDLLEKDNSIRDNMLIVNYRDFCHEPANILKTIYNHCDLRVKECIIEEQASLISPPSYYKPEFSNAEMKIISEETRNTEDRIQGLISS